MCERVLFSCRNSVRASIKTKKRRKGTARVTKKKKTVTEKIIFSDIIVTLSKSPNFRPISAKVSPKSQGLSIHNS